MLAIDCGNTRIKWAQYESGGRPDAGEVSWLDTPDAVTALAEALPETAGRVLVANVAGDEAGRQIAAAVSARLGTEPEFVVVEGEAHGIECGYRDPSALGVDRWLAMIAVRARVDGPFAVVCAGTAVTFDAVAEGGRHCGGLILPGSRLMARSLADHTGRIPLVEPAAEPVASGELLGRSTAEAVGRGVQLALAAAIDRAAAGFAAELGRELPLIVTGGDARKLAPWLHTTHELRADLVLDGLAIIGGG
jgi:type III pantothenate kinase